MKLTEEEEAVWWSCRNTRAYPRWKRYSTGFLLYRSPGNWGQEAFKHFNGTWSVGRKSDGTERVFSSLQDALNYGEFLEFRKSFAEFESRLGPEVTNWGKNEAVVLVREM